MCRVPVQLRELVKQRLAAAAEEIFELLERTIAEYEEESERQRTLLGQLLLETRGQSRGTAAPGAVFEEAPPPEPQEPLEPGQEPSSRGRCEEDPESDTAPPADADLKAEEEPLFSEFPSYLFNSAQEPTPEASVPAPKAPQKKIRHHCPFCGKAFVKTDNFKCHLRTHTGEKPFICSVCGKCFAYHASFNNHKLTHGKDPPPRRQHEDTAPPTDADLKAEEEPLFSEFPSYLFNSAQEPTPEASVPAPKAPQKKIRHHCPFCGKAFVKTDNFKCHLRTHTGEKPFICSVCGKRFAYHASFNNHKLTHSGERPFGCSVCGKDFVLKAVLKQHMFTHQREKPFSCSVCGKGFCNKQGLKLHLNKHL